MTSSRHDPVRFSQHLGKVLAVLMDREGLTDPADVNGGLCSAFAALAGLTWCGSEPGDEPEVHTMATVIRLASLPDPGTEPPEGYTWQDVSDMLVEMELGPAAHYFVEYDGRFHDAEAIEGVERLFDLPIFGRMMSSWKCLVDIAECLGREDPRLEEGRSLTLRM